jgi:cytochrome bd-type quinol oxidase subunit 2
VFFVLWIVMSALAILADGIEIKDHPDRADEVFSHMAVALLLCVPFGAVGFILRRRRLKKQAERQAFLCSVADSK